ncbi:MAG: hypothetical protein K9G58_16110 [Bacteroidales bacterium]|nr:hypothetical protein [Bacteroidales bacterium]MCF8399693.1 hypothetical protein [Bacteroidales bacterium]
MERTTAKIISYLFHPLLMPTYVMAILLNIHAYFALVIPQEAKWRIIFLVFAITFVFPVLITYLMIRIRLIRSFEMHSREERVLPLITTVVFFYLAYYLIKEVNISPLYSYFAIGATFVAVITLILNFFWKISIHMMGMGAVFGTLLGLSLTFYISIPNLIFLSLLIAGLTGFARLKLQAHKPPEIYIGFLSSAVIMLLLFLFV